MGGTSSINNLHYLRALPEDFNQWSNEEQHGWKANQIKQNYRRHEYHVHGDSESQGFNEELKLNKLNENSAMKDLIYDGAEIMGYNRIKSEEYLGYKDVLGTLENGTRLNFAKAFLRPIRNRPNLAVARNALVTKVKKNIVALAKKKLLLYFYHFQGTDSNTKRPSDPRCRSFSCR